MDTIYVERANGRNEYWTYSDGQRVYLDASWVRLELKRKCARLIDIEAIATHRGAFTNLCKVH